VPTHGHKLDSAYRTVAISRLVDTGSPKAAAPGSFLNVPSNRQKPLTRSPERKRFEGEIDATNKT